MLFVSPAKTSCVMKVEVSKIDASMFYNEIRACYTYNKWLMDEDLLIPSHPRVFSLKISFLDWLGKGTSYWTIAYGWKITSRSHYKKCTPSFWVSHWFWTGYALLGWLVPSNYWKMWLWRRHAVSCYKKGINTNVLVNVLVKTISLINDITNNK